MVMASIQREGHEAAASIVMATENSLFPCRFFCIRIKTETILIKNNSIRDRFKTVKTVM
jgi:hypothetical protein